MKIRPKYYTSKSAPKAAPLNSAFTADISFLLLVLLLFISVVAIVTNPAPLLQNVMTLFVIFVVMIITAFTSLTTGLILNLILIFGYGTYLLYTAIVLQAQHEPITYAWMILSVLITTAAGMMFRGMRGIEAQFHHMSKQVEEYVTIDVDTHLKTRHAFEQELASYQSMARRYNHQLLLIVWEFRFYSEMQRYLGKEKLQNVAVSLSHAMQQTFRNEDAIYLVSRNPYRWGSLILVKPDSEQIIINRMRQKIEAMDLTEELGKNTPRLEVRVGAMVDAQMELTAEEFLSGAISQMQYDV